jgi:hypothetical protein
VPTIPPVEVKALWDGNELKQGTEEGARAVEDFAREVDTAAEDINASLKSVDDGVSSSLASGGTLDQGTDQASSSLKDFADNAKEEVPGAMLDMQDGVASAASGIAAALAPMGAGGLVIASVLAGFTILKTRADEAAQAMRDQINTALGAIEVKARTTNAAIERMYEKQLTFEQTLERMGDGDATKGYERIAGYAETLGVETEAVVAYIQGRMTPATERVADLLARHNRELAESGDKLRENWGTMTEQQVVAGTLGRLAAQERDVRDRTLAIEKDARDYLRDQADASDRLAENSRRIADDSRRGADANRTAAEQMERWAAAAERLSRQTPGDWALQ